MSSNKFGSSTPMCTSDSDWSLFKLTASGYITSKHSPRMSRSNWLKAEFDSLYILRLTATFWFLKFHVAPPKNHTMNSSDWCKASLQIRTTSFFSCHAVHVLNNKLNGNSPRWNEKPHAKRLFGWPIQYSPSLKPYP